MPLIHPLIYDWNERRARPARRPVMLDDETLRDGLQSPSVHARDRGQARHPAPMDALGIDSADIGLPGAGPHAPPT